MLKRHLSVWVLACMAVEILIEKFLPVVPEFLGKLEIARISIPIAILIWVMIYPVMLTLVKIANRSKGAFHE